MEVKRTGKPSEKCVWELSQRKDKVRKEIYRIFSFREARKATCEEGSLALASLYSCCTCTFTKQDGITPRTRAITTTGLLRRDPWFTATPRPALIEELPAREWARRPSSIARDDLSHTWRKKGRTFVPIRTIIRDDKNLYHCTWIGTFA